MTIEERVRAGITVEELREKYPNPVSHPERLDGHNEDGEPYCVAWTLCREMGVGTVWEAFALANPHLSSDDAKEFLDHIIDENDAGNFEDAWSWLRKGLES